jgi:glycosyltransferase involved in cell wall biosynthesis
VPAGDEAALAAALVRIFSLNEVGRRALGARGRAWVLDSFDAATAAERMLAVYAEVAGARKR